MKTHRIAITLLFMGVLLSCTTPSFNEYQRDMFMGRGLMQHGSFSEARDTFLRAANEQRRASAYAFAATASYKMGDYQAAERYATEASMASAQNYVRARLLGYRALAILAQGRKEEGLAALKEYIDQYKLLYPLMSIEEVQDMWQTGEIRQKRLAKLIDDEVTNYEQEITQAATTGTGYYATRPPRGIPSEAFTID